MLLPLFRVDAFTNRPFAGNPAAVCLLPSTSMVEVSRPIAPESLVEIEADAVVQS